MTDIAIRVDNPCPERSRRTGKLYRIGGARARYKALRDTLTDAVAAPFRRIRGAPKRHRSPSGGSNVFPAARYWT
jgi:hypothetical protein